MSNITQNILRNRIKFSRIAVVVLRVLEALPGPSQTSKKESFATIVNNFWPVIIIAKVSYLRFLRK